MINVKKALRLIREGDAAYFKDYVEGGVAGKTRKEISSWIEVQEKNLRWTEKNFELSKRRGEIKPGSSEEIRALTIISKLKGNLATHREKLRNAKD